MCARFYVFGALIHCGRRRGGLRMFRSPLSVFQCKFPLSFITCLFFFSQKLQFLWLIGNKTSCRPIQSAVTLVINKSDSHCPVVRFCYHSYDNRPNWTPLSPTTITYYYRLPFHLFVGDRHSRMRPQYSLNPRLTDQMEIQVTQCNTAFCFPVSHASSKNDFITFRH